MKNRLYYVVCIFFLVFSASGCVTSGQDYPKTNEPSGEPYDWTRTKKPERPYIHQYHKTLVMKIFLASKLPNQECEVYLTFEQALEVIHRLDNITIGIPKIVYLVGWQFNGHDSKYPAWSEVNPRLKRPQDKNARESLLWLMREGFKHNTTVSFHINMFDAYEDSPLWKEYVEHDIIAKEKDGTLKKAEMHGGEQSYPISYAREWDTGYAKKRIDGLLAMLPIQRAGTIHIDAFHPAVPMWRHQDYFSPYLDYTVADEVATQRKIVRYWRDRGVDVTMEGTGQARNLIGLVPMGWHFRPIKNCPPTVHCGTPMHAEPEIKRDPNNFSPLIEQFCLKVVPWYYSNNVADPDSRTMFEADGVTKVIIPSNICMPALWRKRRTLVAYSRSGYETRVWKLPPQWKDVKKVSISRITLDGPEKVSEASVSDAKLILNVGKGEALMISPKQ